jgi:hypothetical protein
MNHWAFVIAAYAVMLVGTAGLAIASFAAMHRAEKAARALKAGK